MTMTHFDGANYSHRLDGLRLAHQFNRVFDVMKDGRWRSLLELEEETGDTSASISAQLRNARKSRFGSHTVEKQRLGHGHWKYKLTVNQ